MSISFKTYKEARELINEGRIEDLKRLAIDAINSTSDSNTMDDIMAVLNKPIINANLDKWADKTGLAGLPLVPYIKNLFINATLPFEDKIEATEALASGEPLMDVAGLIKSSSGKIAKVTSAYKNRKVCEFLMPQLQKVTDASLLKAPTNIGQGEVALIVMGNLSKPTKGDLEVPGVGTCELKTPGAGIAPKKLVHPSKVVGDVQSFCKKKKIPFPTDKKEAALLLKIKSLRATNKKAFPLGDYFKENDIPVNTLKELITMMFTKVYAQPFNAGQYVGNDYKMDYDGLGAASFMHMLNAYKKETGFDTLIYADFNTGKMFSASNDTEAKALYARAGEVNFEAHDFHGRSQTFGGKISPGKTVFA